MKKINKKNKQVTVLTEDEPSTDFGERIMPAIEWRRVSNLDILSLLLSWYKNTKQTKKHFTSHLNLKTLSDVLPWSVTQDKKVTYTIAIVCYGMGYVIYEINTVNVAPGKEELLFI